MRGRRKGKRGEKRKRKREREREKKVFVLECHLCFGTCFFLYGNHLKLIIIYIYLREINNRREKKKRKKEEKRLKEKEREIVSV